jgi:hypothetical protein
MFTLVHDLAFYANDGAVSCVDEHLACVERREIVAVKPYGPAATGTPEGHTPEDYPTGGGEH